MSTPRRGELWSIDSGVLVLVVSSTVYNEIASEPTVVVMPVLSTAPETGFGVDIGRGWAVPGLIASLRKAHLDERIQQIDDQRLIDVNAMLFRVLATPER